MFLTLLQVFTANDSTKCKLIQQNLKCKRVNFIDEALPESTRKKLFGSFEVLAPCFIHQQ